MKFLLIIFCIILVTSCKNTMKLAVPTKFAEQAEMLEVKGARSKHVSFGNYHTSKIKRGWHTSSSRYGKGFFFENLLLNQAGIRKDEIISKEKDKFRFTLSDNNNNGVDVFAQEFQGEKTLNYKLGKGNGIFDSYSRLQQYQYLLSATIIADTASAPWQMVMSNSYDRKADTVNSIFTMPDNEDHGIATNGTDTIVIKPLNLRKAVGPGDKEGKMPFKVLSGYELRMEDGVVAIVDNIG
ncbi:MAG TPA: hypothetical protein VHM26_16615, partial [Chitinophagaceae bacterium]|nr:hypothetical protein [Chitinophagaceae bacterium]